MTTKRKRYSGEFKAEVALEALKGRKTVELAAGYGVHPTQISQWKRHLGAKAKEIFGSRRAKGPQEGEALQASLYEEIGRLKMELDWVKKLRASAEEKRLWIDLGRPELRIRRQCALVGAVPLECRRRRARAVVHTEAADTIRIISIRKATKHEQAPFFEGIQD